MPAQDDKAFTGAIPEIYERFLVPMLFESYARDLADRISARSATDLLELAAGTGVVTRAFADRLPADVSIVATDLNQAMVDQAASVGTSRPVEWRQADAMELPFPDESFDIVACQFGVMFFPDKVHAFSEAHRVLRPGGALVFNVWDRIEENEVADVIEAALEKVFPEDPPRFLSRTPYAYYDAGRIQGDLREGGFTSTPKIDVVSARGPSESARSAAVAFCQGTPLRVEIESKDASRIGDATDAAAAAITERFGSGPVEGKIQALVVAVEKPGA